MTSPADLPAPALLAGPERAPARRPQRRTQRRPRRRAHPTAIVGDCLSTAPVEGAETVAGRLLAKLGPDALVLCVPRPHDGAVDPAWHPLLHHRLVPWTALRVLRRARPREVVWIQHAGLTYALLLRLLLARLLLPRATIRAVLLQRYRTPPRWFAHLWSWLAVAVVANEADRAVLTSFGWRTELLEVEAPEDRVSDLDRAEARRALGLPVDGPVFLHVGHATHGRNLGSLAPLADGCDGGVLALVLSPHSPLMPETLPVGPGLRTVHQRVDVGPYYRAADVYVFPTTDRNSAIAVPMSVVEAIANRTPVVARRSALTERFAEEPLVHLVDSDSELVATARRLAGSR